MYRNLGNFLPLNATGTKNDLRKLDLMILVGPYPNGTGTKNKSFTETQVSS